MRFIASAVGALALLAGSAVAEEPETGRYAIEANIDGFVRLDTETGAASHCKQRDGVWRCAVLTEDHSALDTLAADVASLAAGLEALTERVMILEAVEPPTSPDRSDVPAPGFAETLMDRLFLLVRDIKQVPPSSG